MKKTLILFLAFLLVITALPVFAESVDDYFVPFLVTDGYTECPGGEDVTTMNIAFNETEYGYYDGFSITINGQYAEKTGEYLSGNVYAMHMGGNHCPIWGTLFMVEDYGMSDYSMTYCFLVAGGEVYDCGMIPGCPDTIVFNDNGSFTTTNRSYLLGTWNYTVDYVIAYGYYQSGEDYFSRYAIVPVPQDIYTMRSIVTLNVDLPVLATVQDTQYSNTIYAGQPVVLTATDLISRVYVSTADGSVGGWVWVDPSEYPTKIAVNGVWVEEDAVFSDIMYAS